MFLEPYLSGAVDYRPRLGCAMWAILLLLIAWARLCLRGLWDV